MAQFALLEPKPVADPVAEASVRPPGSLDAAEFLERCDQFGECLDVCPEALLVQDTEGYPKIVLSNGVCGGCGLCADICTRGAIVDFLSDPAPVTTVDNEAIMRLVHAATPGMLARISHGR